MSTRAVLEVIALGAEDAIAAQAGGADRLELVTDMAADGLTPPVETFAAIRAAVDIDLRVMLRLADGFAAGDVDRLVRVAMSCGPPEPTSSCSGSSARTAASTWTRWSGSSPNWTAAPGRSTARSTAPPTATPCASSSRTCRVWTPTSPCGSADGVDDGLPTLLREAALRGEPGYEQRILVGGGLRLDHVPTLLAAGVDAFHIGGAARPEGWGRPVSTAAVGEWRAVLDRA